MSVRILFAGLLSFVVGVMTSFAQTCPYIEKFLINACGPGTEEGFNEYVLINTGPTGLDVNQLQLCCPTIGIGCYCNSGCGTQTFVSNPGYVSALNAAAGCSPPLFVDAVSNNPLPPNALLLVFTGNPPTITYNFSNHCGQGPIYVLFANNTTDGTGRFGNSTKCTGSSRYQTLSATFSPSCSQDITYDRCNFVNQNGESIIVNPDGSLTYGVTDGCIVLPQEAYILLSVERTEGSVKFKWKFYGGNHTVVTQRLMLKHSDGKIDTLCPEHNATEYMLSVNYSWSPQLAWVEAVDDAGNLIRSNYVVLEPQDVKQIYIASMPHPYLIVSESHQVVDVAIYAMDGTLVWASEKMSIEEANNALEKLYYELDAGAYVIKVNNVYTKLFFK